MEAFAESKRDWLREFFGLEGDLPSHDTFRRIFSLIDPSEFETTFLAWMMDVEAVTEGSVVAIDGKVLRGSADEKKGKLPLHLVSAWASENGVSLGHVPVDSKSNELTAIPQLLEVLYLKGCIVTIDAAGCQRDVCEQITEQKAGYAIALKGNQGKMFEFAEELMQDTDGLDYFETNERKHGREERRRYFVADIFKSIWLEGWPGLEKIGYVKSTRIVNGQAQYSERFYLLSKVNSADKFANAVRSHWLVENACHWILDVTMGEDLCQLREKKADRNLATMRRIAMNKLKKVPDKTSIRQRMNKCALNDAYRVQAIQALTDARA